MLDIDLEMLELGLEGQGGFDRQQKGTRGQLCCLPTIRLSAETFTLPPSLPPSILPFLCLSFFSHPASVDDLELSMQVNLVSY